MAQNGKGALFKNERKTTEKHPDYTGNFVLTRDLLQAYANQMGSGQEIKVNIAGWIATAKGGGTRYIQLNINAPFEDRQSTAKAGAANPFRRDRPDDPIPF